MMYPNFIGTSNSVQSPLADCSRLVNLYLEPADLAGGLPALYPTPGQTLFATATDIGTRALHTMNARSFGVIGAGAYEISSGGALTRLGTMAADNNPAQIIVNGITGNQAMFASGGNAYVLDLTTNILTAAVLTTGNAYQIGMLDGYGVAFNRELGRIRASDLNDFTTWDPTQFAFRSQSPDNWRAMIVHAPDIFLLGEQSGDVWFDSGGTFPFSPRPGASFAYGIAASETLAVAGDSVLWLSRNAEGAGIVVRARGYVPQPIGSYALDTAITSYQQTSTIADAYALAYQRAGHTFYVLTFPTANATWVYDLRTNVWHEQTTNDGAWSPSAITYAFGQHLVGSRDSAVIAKLDDAIGTEADGSPIVRVRVPPPLHATDGGRIYIDRFALGIQTGVGLVSGQGSNPLVMLKASRDGGQTYGNELTRSFGRIGETTTRVFWNRLGSSQTSWVPEIRISDPVPTRIVSASVMGRGFAQRAA